MVGRLLVGFVLLNLQFSVSWLVDFQGGSCGSIFSFLCHCWQTFRGVRVAQSLTFCVMVDRLLVGFVQPNLQFSVSGWQTFGGIRVAQSLVFCVIVGRLLVGFVLLNLLFSVSWLVDFQWCSCGSISTFLSLLVDFQWGSCGSIFSFLCHGWQTFSGVRVAQSFVFCVMVGRLLVGFVWLNLQISVSWLVDCQWDSCGSIFSLLCHGRQTFSGVRVTQTFVFCVMVGRLLVGFVWLNFSFLCHCRQTFSGVRVAQYLVFCVMVGRLLVGLVWLNLQFSVSWLEDFQWCSCGSISTFLSWLVDFQWGSCCSIFSFLCHGWQTFCGVRLAQSFVFCVMVGRLLVGFVWLNLVFCVMVGRLLMGFVWLNQFSVSWQVDFQWGSCDSIFSFLCHGWQTFSGVRVAQSLDFCVMVGRILVGFVWLNLLFSLSWLVDFQWVSCGSIFSFLCHGRQTFSGVRLAQSLVFCVMNCRLLGGFVWLNRQFSVSQQVDFQGGSCGSIQFSVSWLVDFQWGSRGSIFSFLCHG